MDECLVVVLQCLILSLIYVSSLYVWNCRYDRDNPSTIIKRFISVSIVALISPVYLYFCLNPKILYQHTLWDLLGLRIVGLGQAIFYPLFLNVILFLGPVSYQLSNGTFAMYADKSYWSFNFQNLIWIRNYVVAPLFEEITYRACMVPLLFQCFNHLIIIIICPVFFGAAHFNNLLENVRAGIELKRSLALACSRFLYTTVFGAYSTFLFLRTGHLTASVLAHVFCNYMGFPDFEAPLLYSGIKKFVFILLFIVGFVAWCIFLIPVTEPTLYHNSLYWDQNYSYTNHL